MSQELASKSIADLASHLRRAINAGQFGIPADAIAELVQTVGELVRRTREKTTRSSPFNARYLTAIESRIWATTYGSQYASGQLPIRCAEMANTAVTDFRALYPETE